MKYLLLATSMLFLINVMAEDNSAPQEIIQAPDMDVVAHKNKSEVAKEEEDFVDRELTKLEEVIEKKKHQKEGLQKMRKKLPVAERTLLAALKEKIKWEVEVDGYNKLVQCENDYKSESCQKLLAEDGTDEKSEKVSDEVKVNNAATIKYSIYDRYDSRQEPAGINPTEYINLVDFNINSKYLKGLSPCYRGNFGNEIKGTLKTIITIDKSGHVGYVSIVNPDILPSMEARQCMTSVMSGWKFPPAPNGEFKFDYHISFNTKS
jgi:hypothetical protein